MFSDGEHPHYSHSDGPGSRLRFGMMLAEVWHDWFAALSEVAYQTHRACEFLAENGESLNRKFDPFDFRPGRGRSEESSDSIDMDRLKECLQSLDPMDAARVFHAVQVMQIMEGLRKKRKSRGDEEEEATW